MSELQLKCVLKHLALVSEHVFNTRLVLRRCQVRSCSLNDLDDSEGSLWRFQFELEITFFIYFNLIFFLWVALTILFSVDTWDRKDTCINPASVRLYYWCYGSVAYNVQFYKCNIFLYVSKLFFDFPLFCCISVPF